MAEEWGLGAYFHISTDNSEELLLKRKKKKKNRRDSCEDDEDDEILPDDPVKLPLVEKSKKDKLFHCPFEKCKKAEESRGLIRLHMRNVHVLDHKIQANGSYECPICDSSFKRKGNVSVHVRYVHKLLCVVNIEASKIDSKYHCSVCDLKSETLCELNIHLRQIHEDYFTKLLAAQQNKLTSIDNEYRIYKCIYCKRAFTTKSNLLIHQAVNTDEKKNKNQARLTAVRRILDEKTK